MATVPTSRLAEDYEQITRACGLLDRSERGKLALTGPDAAAFLNGQVTNDVEALGEGEGCYAAFLTHKGKMLGDLRVLCAGSGDAGAELALDTERVALQALFDMIRRFKVGYAVELHKRTLERGLLSLIGPAARRVAAAATRPARDLEANGGSAPTAAALALAPDEHANVAAQIAGAPVLLISTDVGVDVLCDAQATADVGAALVRAGARSVQEAAAETLRVEHGRPRYGIDLNEGTIPQEAGLNERAVSFTKGCYVGQETVARLFYRGKPNRHLRGLLLGAPAAAGAELRQGERTVGQLGSSLVSPRLGPIALALVRREVRVDAELSLPQTSARVTELPFG
jgi:tRNA-modifying protein YgfZ